MGEIKQESVGKQRNVTKGFWKNGLKQWGLFSLLSLLWSLHHSLQTPIYLIRIVFMTAIYISWGHSRCSINISLNWGRCFSSPVCISVRSAKTSFGCNRFSTWRALPQLKRKETTNEEKLQQEEQDERGTRIFIPTGNNCLEIAWTFPS